MNIFTLLQRAILLVKHLLALTFHCFATQENKHWEDSFQVYERGVALFKYPHVKDIWNAYLAQFVKRYAGTKLERARDLFRHALEMVRNTAPICSSFGEGNGSGHRLRQRSLQPGNLRLLPSLHWLTDGSADKHFSKVHCIPTFNVLQCETHAACSCRRRLTRQRRCTCNMRRSKRSTAWHVPPWR